MVSLRFWRKNPQTPRIPQVGDPVWWAPKQVGCVITARHPDGSMTFQGGEIVKNVKGRQVPRWTAMTGRSTYLWDARLRTWVVGQGPIPKIVRGLVVQPQPVALSGSAQGSFAAERKG